MTLPRVVSLATEVTAHSLLMDCYGIPQALLTHSSHLGLEATLRHVHQNLPPATTFQSVIWEVMLSLAPGEFGGCFSHFNHFYSLWFICYLGEVEESSTPLDSTVFIRKLAKSS